MDQAQIIKQILEDSTVEAVDRLIANENLRLAEYQKARLIAEFLLALKTWKDNMGQRMANHLPILPPPVPPPGYVVPADPVVTTPAPNFTPVVQEENSWGQFPAPGDENPAGAKITHDGVRLVKVIRNTPFGPAHWWERDKS